VPRFRGGGGGVARLDELFGCSVSYDGARDRPRAAELLSLRPTGQTARPRRIQASRSRITAPIAPARIQPMLPTICSVRIARCPRPDAESRASSSGCTPPRSGRIGICLAFLAGPPCRLCRATLGIYRPTRTCATSSRRWRRLPVPRRTKATSDRPGGTIRTGSERKVPYLRGVVEAAGIEPASEVAP
jgi:hypothetical protein